MQPVFNPYLRPDANNTPPANNPQPPQQQQAFRGQNAPMQIPPQMGMVNPQFPVPFNNPGGFPTNSGQQLQNMLPFMNQQQQEPGNYVNANANLLGVLQMALSAQNQINNLNALGMLLNQSQQQGQMFAPTWPNQNMGYPNFQNPMQSMNPAVPVQMPNFPQVPQPASFNVPPCTTHPMGGRQDPNFFQNSHSGAGQQVRPNQQNFSMPTMGANVSQQLPVPTQHVEANSPGMQQAQNSQPGGSNRWQEKGQGSNQNSNWKNNSRKNFRKDFNQGAPQSGHQKLQSHHTNNGKRKFGFPNDRRGKDHGYERAGKNDRINPVSQAEEKKRKRLPCTYTEQEIIRWRDARRTNYPSNSNIEQKRAREAKSSEDIDREAKLLREELKEVVAKQVELGCQVAEIPEHYLSDLTKDIVKGKGNEGSKRGRKHNRHGKRGKKNSRNIPAETNTSSANIKRKPTLLQQLLSADVRKDNRHLLQVLRFMVMNSFFKDWPNKALEFPLVVYEEDGRQKLVGGKSGQDSGEDDEDDDNSSEDNGKTKEDAILPEQGHRTHEEGEIVD